MTVTQQEREVERNKFDYKKFSNLGKGIEKLARALVDVSKPHSPLTPPLNPPPPTPKKIIIGALSSGSSYVALVIYAGLD